MIKTYEAMKTITLLNYNNNAIPLTSGDTIEMDETVAAVFVDQNSIKLSTTWNYVCSGQAVGTGASTEDVSATYRDLVAGTTILCTVAIPGTSANGAPAGSVLTMTIKNAAGATKETRTHTFGAIAISADETATFVTPSGLLSGDDVTFDLSLEEHASDAYDADAYITLQTPTSVAGAIFTVGASVAATNPIVTNIQFVDSDGADINARVVCEVFPLADFDTLVSLTACTSGTDGTSLGAIATNSSFIALSESDGDLDVTMTNGSAGDARVGLKLPDGTLLVSDIMTWS